MNLSNEMNEHYCTRCKQRIVIVLGKWDHMVPADARDWDCYTPVPTSWVKRYTGVYGVHVDYS